MKTVPLLLFLAIQFYLSGENHHNSTCLLSRARQTLVTSQRTSQSGQKHVYVKHVKLWRHGSNVERSLHGVTLVYANFSADGAGRSHAGITSCRRGMLRMHLTNEDYCQQMHTDILRYETVLSS